MQGIDQSRVVDVLVDCPMCLNTNRQMRRHCKTCGKRGLVLKSVPVSEANAILHEQVLKTCEAGGTERLEQHHWTWLKMNSMSVMCTAGKWELRHG